MRNNQRGEQDWLPEMIHLFKRQVELYVKLQALADKQRTLISSADTQPLLAVLARKKRLTAELAELSKRMAPLREKWQQDRNSLTQDDRAKVENLIGEVSSHLQGLLAADEHDAGMLKLRKQRVSKDLESIHSNRRALAAYGGGCATGTACFDQTHGES